MPWSTELDEQVRLAHNEAFADHWGSEPRTAQEWAQGRSMFAPTWSFAAIDEATGEVAGYLMSARYEQDWAIARLQRRLHRPARRASRVAGSSARGGAARAP